MTAVQAVLWDVDGTLISTKDLYLECYRRALAPYVGKRLTNDELLALRPRSEFHLLHSQAADAYDACLTDFRRHYAELHATHFGGIYQGVAETLLALRQRGIRTGLVSGKSRSSWEVTRVAVELGEFDVVILDDDVANPKPDPEGIRLALDALGVRPRHAVYVGDTLGDLQAAHAAGVMPVAAMWSHPPHRARRFETAAADYGARVAGHPSDIIHLMG